MCQNSFTLIRRYSSLISSLLCRKGDVERVLPAVMPVMRERFPFPAFAYFYYTLSHFRASAERGKSAYEKTLPVYVVAFDLNYPVLNRKSVMR